MRCLRPLLADDGLVVAASEVGVIEMPDEHIVEKGRLSPGEMIVVDTARRRILKKPEIMAEVVNRRPYGRWIKSTIAAPSYRPQRLRAYQPPAARASAAAATAAATGAA